MNDEHKIIQQVYAAKEDMEAADRLIGAYMPFIKAETAKFLKRPPMEGHDDELSIAMIAFHEAIRGYSRSRGAFLKYAAMLIKSRLIDYHRREQKHSNVISLDTPAGEEDTPLGDTIADEADHNENLVIREATRTEIEELTRQMQEFGVSLTDVAENCPKQQRTLLACRKALWYAKEHPELLEELLGAGFPEKTAIQMINTTLVMGREEIHYSTVDMTVFDLYTGECEIIKAGASSTFIKKKDCVEHLSSTSLPIGVMNHIEIDSVKRKLEDGDFVIMVTDGVLDALPVGEQDILLETIIQGTAMTNPREIAHHILEQVLAWTGKEPADDMTVLAVGIWEV